MLNKETPHVRVFICDLLMLKHVIKSPDVCHMLYCKYVHLHLLLFIFVFYWSTNQADELYSDIFTVVKTSIHYFIQTFQLYILH